MIFRAIEFASKAHSGKYRKVSRIPYINHPLGVAKIVIEFGFEEEPLAVAAVLHDTVEDSATTVNEIREEFGYEVASLVDSLSTASGEFEAWRERKTKLLRSLEAARFEVLVLSCADKLDNVRSIRSDVQRIGNAVWQALHGEKTDQCWYYRSLSDLFSRRLVNTRGHALAAEFQKEINRVFERRNGNEEDES